MSYADDTTVYEVIPRPLSSFQVKESLNQDLAVIDSWCLKWLMRLNPKKTKSIVANQSRTNASGYGDLTLGDAKLEEINSLRILGVTLNSLYVGA